MPRKGHGKIQVRIKPDIFPRFSEPGIFPWFKPENLLLITARFPGSNLGSKLTYFPGLFGSNLTKYAGFTCKYHFTGID